MTDEKPRKLPLLHKFMLALIVALVTAEVAVRVADWRAGRTIEFYMPGDPMRRLVDPHPFLSYAHRPGATIRGNLEHGGQWVDINNLGMRGSDMPKEKPAGTYRILCLGGSTTLGTGASKNETTYPARLEHYLNEMATGGVTYEVGNCGVNGYSTVENLILLELHLVEYDPDAIVIYHAANDARPIQARGFRPDYTHVRRPWTETELSDQELFLLENVRLYAWLTRGTDPEKQLRALGNRLFVPDVGSLHQRSDEVVPEEGVDVFFRNLRSMVLIARGHGIEPVLSTFALCDELQEPDNEHFLGTVSHINERYVEFTAELDVPLLRIADTLDGRCDLFDDWMHLNDAGSDVHGKTVAEEARRLGLFGLK